MRRGAPGLRQLQRRLAANIRLLRQTRHLSQEELSSGAGLAVRHLQKIESGEVNVTLKTLASLAAALDVDPHALLQEPQRDRGR
jgi:transcriptional regulator with XRE-family HTH domain